MRRHCRLQHRLRAAAVLAPRRREHGVPADVRAASPVAGRPAERAEARLAAVGRDTDTIDACATHDRNTPASVGAGTKDGERVVVDGHPLRPTAPLEAGANSLFLGGKVDPRE